MGVKNVHILTQKVSNQRVAKIPIAVAKREVNSITDKKAETVKRQTNSVCE
jgi:hypothetical protein